MRLAVIGDVHLYRLWAAPWRLFGKRFVGQSNLWLNRRYRFDRALANPVIDHAISVAPERFLFSGDLTTTATPSELFDAAALVQRAADHAPVSVVPGNHDRYTFASGRTKSMERVFGSLMPPSFPHTQQLFGNWQLMLLDSAVARVISSRGRIDAHQFEQAARIFESLTPEQGVIVVCHYAIGCPPPYPPQKPHHQLENESALIDALRKTRGKVVYVHGHVHQSWLWQRGENWIDLNAGSPCLVTSKCPAGQGFWQLDLPEAADLSQVQFTRHLPSREGGELKWAAESVPLTTSER